MRPPEPGKGSNGTTLMDRGQGWMRKGNKKRRRTPNEEGACKKILL